MSDSDDQNTTQNPISEETSLPTSPQEPTEPAPENTTVSEPVEVPSEAPEAPGEGFSAESNNIPPSNFTPTEAEKEPERQSQNKPKSEPISELEQAPEPLKAQTSTNEPLTETGVKPVEVKISQPSRKNMSELLAKEHLAIQNRKRKKLDRILDLFAKQTKITNDEVEKLLHISDATATRYLSQLEKEGKIQKNEKSGKKGKWVSYSRI